MNANSKDRHMVQKYAHWRKLLRKKVIIFMSAINLFIFVYVIIICSEFSNGLSLLFIQNRFLA